jgi:carboxyl-terminal processing protease
MNMSTEKSGTKKIMRKNGLLLILLAAILLPAVSITYGEEVPEAERLKIITRLTAKLLGQQHYRQQPLNGKMSARIFDEYFRVLDPNKMYFTQSDVDRFEPQRKLLADELNAGNADFAFQVYDVFMSRFQEFQQFAQEELKKPFDFTVDESFTPDRRNLPRAVNEDELKKLWRARLKNDILYFKLIQRSLAENGGGSVKPDEKEAIRKLWERKSPAEKVMQRLHDLDNYYRQREKIDILSMYLAAVAQVYGPHSGYLPPKLDEDFEINMSLSLTGIGATLTSDDGYIRVVDLVPGGPAALSGKIQIEDRIIAVTQQDGDPVDVIDMSVDNAVKLIRGPADTKVTLTILSGKKGRNAIPENVTLTRAKVELKASEAKGEIKTVTRADGKALKIGLISLPSFYMDFAAAFRGDPDYKSCTRDVKKILDGFKAEKVDAVLIDLRNNGGGSLPEAISLTGLFITSGPVVQVRQANRSTQTERDEDPGIAWDGPLVIVTNKFSASAAEIFAGAIKDYQRGLIVGDTRTFGKGTVLNMIALERMLGFINRNFPAGSVRLETAMFFRVNGDSVQQLGIKPDIVLPSLTEQMEVGEMFSDNHLPWDAIPEQSYRLYDKKLPERLPDLAAKSQQRIAASAEYQKLLRRIEIFKTQMSKTCVSLREETRWKEYQTTKAEAELTEKELEDAEQGRRQKPENDPILDEAAHIAADLVG